MDKQELIATLAASVYPGIIALQNDVRREHGIPHGGLIEERYLFAVTNPDPIDGSIEVAQEIWSRVLAKGRSL